MIFQHNKITDVSGLDSCLQLQSLSLGENLISSLSKSSLEELGLLHNLVDLNMIGNPISKKDYEKAFRQYLPTLIYLDNKKVQVPREHQHSESESRTKLNEGILKVQRLTLLSERIQQILSDQTESETRNTQQNLSKIYEVLNNYKDTIEQSMNAINDKLNYLNDYLDKSSFQNLEEIEMALEKTSDTRDLVNIELNAFTSLNRIISSQEENIMVEREKMTKYFSEVKHAMKKYMEEYAKLESEVNANKLQKEDIIDAIETTMKETNDTINEKIRTFREKILRQHRHRIQELNIIDL